LGWWSAASCLSLGVCAWINAYILKDLEAAKTKLEGLNEKWDRDSGNDPDKYRPAMRAAMHEVECIERR